MAESSKSDTQQMTKLQKEEDGKKAMAEYEARAAAIQAKTERLRALRLAREAQQPAAPKKGAKKAAAKKGSQTKSTTTLAAWLKDRQGSGHRS